MKLKDQLQLRANALGGYGMIHWEMYDFSRLNNIRAMYKAGRSNDRSYNDCIIMADTETSKKPYLTKLDNGREVRENHVVAWTISLRAYNRNIVTLYGHRPSTICRCMSELIKAMPGYETIIYFHNLSYDFTFLERFMFQEFGKPVKQLNTKAHYPIRVEFANGLILKDSLILAQRSLDRWSQDLDVEHKKAIGKWDYDKYRNQDETFSADELEYIEHDTLAGVECIQKMIDSLGKHLYSMPYTATGIPRELLRIFGKPYHAHDKFLAMSMDYAEYCFSQTVYHGGYTHSNRYYNNETLYEFVQCFDFASSYPYILLAFDNVMDKWIHIEEEHTPEWILENEEKYGFMFTLTLVKPRVKKDTPMPYLQYSKSETINAVLDNGRIICADYVSININNDDLYIIYQNYDWDYATCSGIMAARKRPLPKWFTDFVYQCFVEKTKLKGSDKVLYNLAKSRLNSLYGCCVQQSVKKEINEDYDTGEYSVDMDQDEKTLYDKYLKNHNTILPYQWGIFVTSRAARNLFELGKCCEHWYYSDTDSIYGSGWDMEKVNAYNEDCKRRLLEHGYGPVIHNGREYWLGIAEHEEGVDDYTEFRYQGAKRYCGRCVADGKVHITVAGVPKKNGAKVLQDDVNNFKPGLIFPGTITGKKGHTYIYKEIYTDPDGNETANSIDLNPCDYLLDGIEIADWESDMYEYEQIPVFEDI